MADGFQVKCKHCQGVLEDVIPKDRFDKVYEERATLRTEVEDLRKSGKSADKIAQKLEAAEKALSELTTKHEVDLAMLDIGIKDPEVREALEWQYGKLPADTRAPFTDTVKAWHEKPEEAPAVVRSLLPKPQPAQPLPFGQDATKPNGAAIQRPGFGRHTNGLEGSGTNRAYEPGTIRAKMANGTLTQADLDAASAALSGKPPPQQKAS